MSDVGLLRRKSNLDSKIVVEGNKLFEEFKGALTENFILNIPIFMAEYIDKLITLGMECAKKFL